MEQFCPWESAKFLIYSSNVPELLLYSHIPAIVVALFVSIGVFFRSGKSRIGIVLLIIGLLFSIWSLVDLVLWATNRPDIVMFFWSLQILIEPLIYLLGFYLSFLFIKGKDLSFKYKLIVLFLYSPIIIFLPTSFSLLGVDLTDCTAVENFVAQYFTYIFELLFILIILILIDKEYRKNTDSYYRKKILIFGFGIIVFLFAMSWGNLIGSFTDNWNLAQAGLIGMPIFVGLLAYLIVKFHLFNIKLISTQALVWGLGLLIGAQFFFIKVTINYFLTGITLLAIVIFGRMLIKSVKKEIKQKEELAKLNIDLNNLLSQRESLVHLVTHKVKGSFTRSKYIFAGILDGMFGEVNDEVKKRAQQGLDSDNGGIDTVDLVLNAANLQKGTVKYDIKNFDFRELVEKVISEKELSVEARGLKLEKDIKEDTYKLFGDAFWLKEALNNLIENSIKYTKEGTITIGLKKENGQVLFYVKDTGIGITDEDKKNLFTEGGRGKDSVKVNVDSTGYGLYSVKLIVEAHKGKVWVDSEVGKGSTFWISLNA